MTRDERELSWQRFRQHKFQCRRRTWRRAWHGYRILTWEYTHLYRQLIVPYPNVLLSFGGGEAEVHGVSSGHLLKELDGSGRVFGVAFQPGCFRPFLGGPVQSITDRSIPAAEVFRDLPDESEVHTVEKMLRTNLPARDPKAELATEIVNGSSPSRRSSGSTCCEPVRHECPAIAAPVRRRCGRWAESLLPESYSW